MEEISGATVPLKRGSYPSNLDRLSTNNHYSGASFKRFIFKYFLSKAGVIKLPA